VSDARLQFVESAGGARLAVHRLGEGRPVLLLHGLFSSAEVNWIKFGHAARLAEAGFEAIMPDLRAHGHSDAPHNPVAYPVDVLVKDAFAIVSTLGLADFDLGGFSLGSRTAVRAVIEGLAPRRLVLGGMGIEGLGRWERRSAFFVDAIDNFETIKRGDPHYLAQQFMKTMKVDRDAVRLLLGSVADIDVATLQRVTMPTLVVCGVDDQDNGSAAALAEALPDATYVEVPGTHMSSVIQSQFGEAIVRFLSV
jgi:pimeloyl-ACP methyl ester carboxylesterase